MTPALNKEKKKDLIASHVSTQLQLRFIISFGKIKAVVKQAWQVVAQGAVTIGMIDELA